MPAGIGPETIRFDSNHKFLAHDKIPKGSRFYILRPEVIESYFVLWRLTRDEKYRDWAWEAAQTIETLCKTEFGYAGLKNVLVPNPETDDVQQSFFLAETLKCVYFRGARVLGADIVMLMVLLCAGTCT